MDEPNNSTRAIRAQRALTAYLGPREVDRLDGDLWSWDEAIRDLVTDLGHLYEAEVSAYQVVPEPDPVNDFKDAIGRAARAFEDERDEENETS